LRWLLVLPGAFLGSEAVRSLYLWGLEAVQKGLHLHFSKMQMAFADGLVGSFLSPLAFVAIGVTIAPSRRLGTAWCLATLNLALQIALRLGVDWLLSLPQAAKYASGRQLLWEPLPIVMTIGGMAAGILYAAQLSDGGKKKRKRPRRVD